MYVHLNMVYIKENTSTSSSSFNLLGESVEHAANLQLIWTIFVYVLGGPQLEWPVGGPNILSRTEEHAHTPT